MSAGRWSVLPIVAGLTVAVVTTSLGNWQMSRAEEKGEWQSKIEAGMLVTPQRPGADIEVEPWMPVMLAGHWAPEASILLDNRVHEGRPGFHVFTPLELEQEGGWVLVNRGWLPAGPRRDQLPIVPVPDVGEALVGQVRVPEAKPYTLAERAGEGLLWQYLDLDAYRAWSGIPVKDWVVFQSSHATDSLIRDWPRPDGGMDRHYGYALQWYSFAVISLLLTGFYVFRSIKPHVFRRHA